MKTALTAINAELDSIRAAGTWREERVITTPQRSRIDTTARDGVVNFCEKDFECVDKGFGEDQEVDVVIRPEDIYIGRLGDEAKGKEAKGKRRKARRWRVHW